MALRLITPAAESPVSLAEVKADLPVIHSSDDAKLQLFIDAAVSYLDGPNGMLGRALVSQTWELVYDAFPSGGIKLPLSPLVSVASVSYYDTAGALVVLDPNKYTVDTASDPGWLVPVDSWPGTYGMANAVVIRFVAGYGAAAAVPASIKAAILLMVRDLYNQTTGEADLAVSRLTRPYRVVQL